MSRRSRPSAIYHTEELTMRHGDRNYLFSDGDLRSFLEDRQEQMAQEVDSYEPNRLLNTPPDDLAAYLETRFRVDPLSLDDANITVDQAETKMDARQDPERIFFFGDTDRPSMIAATAFTFYVPFTGEPALFRHQPSAFSSVTPSADVDTSELTFRFVTAGGDAARVKAQFESELSNVKQYVLWSTRDVAVFNRGLRGAIASKITTRRERLLQASNVTASLGYSMRRREGTPQTYAAPTLQRKLAPSPLATSAAPFRPEPALAMSEYEHILEIVQSMVVVMERSPSAFKHMEEEHLRDHFLVQLNGHYEGMATGETFNVTGKTDIMVRVENRNIFVAECKFWKGATSLKSAIDQILGYLSWRDTKAAVLVFNRNKDFTNVLAQIRDQVPRHANFKQSVACEGETRSRAVFRQPNDASRETIVTVLAFDVPA